MPALRAGVRLRSGVLGGGVACYPEDRLFQEAAYIAYHFHWRKDEILDLPHRERHKWVEEISKINKRINKSAGSTTSSSSTTTYGGIGAFQGPISGLDLSQDDDD